MTTYPDSRARSDACLAMRAGRTRKEKNMEFHAIHAINLTREIREYFGDPSAHIGAVDMAYSEGEMPCLYVDIYANGERFLADVYTDADGNVDWVY